MICTANNRLASMSCAHEIGKKSMIIVMTIINKSSKKKVSQKEYSLQVMD